MQQIYNTGVYPTMITPYKKDTSVDFENVKKYVHWYYEKGCAGIFAVCQSSEIFFLTLEERVQINKTVYEEVQKIARNGGRRMTVVSSGHVSDSIEDQAKELYEIAQSGTDAIVLITNRLAAENESDDVWIANAEKLIGKLPANHSKFEIKEKGGRYYSIASRITDSKCPYGRNLLSLMVSDDGENWRVGTDIINMLDANPEKVGFQYVDFEFDGDDIIYLLPCLGLNSLCLCIYTGRNESFYKSLCT